MSTTMFRAKVREKFSGSEIIFSHHDGLHEAWFPSDEVRITGNMTSNKVTVHWGTGHCAMAVL